ncbi:CGMP-dependent 3',5'-cGMP phosphodiesterase [Phytophthora megakarya]|uniref:cGMP-dependent 3',5'-cGMP phosphodiesterase n=1 Tax=Phytophthora megakarya TaxID=4795 RepID=A0A225USX3_9STRA|nr:CGMP-dependent 3',5'-cGMP phosphodiesterase [Phytophthora megakarya]
MALDESIRKKVYVVHTAAKDLPENCGLRGAPEGVHNTITLDVPRLPENAGALEILDLVRKVDLFAELTLNHAYEILQMARKVEYAKGTVVSKSGSVGDTFYIIIVGEAQAVHNKEPHEPPVVTEGLLPHVSTPANTAPKPIARGRESSTRRRLSMLSLARQYRPGDYFDLQSLLTPNWALPYDMVASTKLSLLEFNALDFNWFLRRTSSFERIQQLAQSRLYFSYDIVESNQVFRRLTSAQRTALEIILRPRDVTEGQVLWNIGDKCSSAVIVDKGQFLLKIAPASSSSNSPGRGGSASTPSRSRPSSPGQTLSLITRKSFNVRGYLAEWRMTIVTNLYVMLQRVLPMDFTLMNGSTNSSKGSDAQEVTLSHGGFAGDVDRLTSTEDTTHATSLVCTRAGSVFVIQQHDLQIFLLENPGLLMSLSGRVFAS